MQKTALKGFTLVELIVVVTIIAILAAVVVLVIDPGAIIRKGRDSSRFTDLANLQQAITTALATETPPSYCYGGGAGATCNYTTITGGDSHNGNRSNNGSGWVNINLSGQTTVSMPVLPIDPTNSGDYYYRYAATNGIGYEINAAMEHADNQLKAQNDGGNSNDRYEVGTSLSQAAN